MLISPSLPVHYISVAETEGVDCDPHFRCAIPALIFETAIWLLQVTAKNMYSSSCSEDEELVDSCASKCSLLQELPMEQY